MIVTFDRILSERLYEPKKEDIIYHYCDANTFHSICSRKCLRFSDLFTMNDSKELYWGYEQLQLAGKEVEDDVGAEFLLQVNNHILDYWKKGVVVAACFSRNGDLLSQWRSYADDGRGYVIGFRAEQICKRLPVTSFNVLYDVPKQIIELKETLMFLHAKEIKNQIKFGPDFETFCGQFSYFLSALKNPAFCEEQEIRSIHLLESVKSGKSSKLYDPGGYYYGKHWNDGNDVQFRMRGSLPVAFIEYDLSVDEYLQPIKEVVLGPKNSVPDTAISVFLETMGITDVEIKRSTSSYR